MPSFGGTVGLCFNFLLGVCYGALYSILYDLILPHNNWIATTGCGRGV